MEEPRKRITIGLVLGWLLGIVFAIVGVVAIFMAPLPGLIALAIAALLLPPVNGLMARKMNFTLSGGVKFIVFVVLFILLMVTLGSKKIDSNEQGIAPTPTPSGAAATNAPARTPAPKTSAPTPTLTPASPTSNQTISQNNAIQKAKSYLSYTAFSHDGLVAQLEYEQFSHADAVYGADNSGANWNEQAAKKAKQYMDYSAFSRGGLIAQLKYDKFTQAQAEYGANAVGL